MTTKNDSYSLLLDIAIRTRDHETMSEILSESRGQILTCVDPFSYSPISSALYQGDEKILKLIKSYINTSIRESDKTYCDEEDLQNILTVMRYPQTELTATDCVEMYLKPLYIDTSKFTELLNAFDDDH